MSELLRLNSQVTLSSVDDIAPHVQGFLANFRSFTPRTVNRNKNQLAAGICVTLNITNKIRDIGIYVTVCETIPVWGSPQYSWCLEHSAGPPGDLHQSAWAPQTP